MTIPHLSDRIDEAELFSYYANALIETGKYAKAIPVLRRLYQRGKTLRQEPMLVTFLQGVSMTDLANQGVELLLRNREIPEEIGDVIQTEHPERLSEDFLFVLEGEAVINAHTLKTYIQKHPSGAGYNMLDSRFRSWIPRDAIWRPATNVVRVFRTLLHLTEKPYYDVQTELKRLLTPTDAHSYYDQFANRLSNIYKKSYKGIHENVNETRAKLELLRLAVRTKLRSQRKGTDLLPIPDIRNSTDPFSGTPYRVKETNSHVILYSVGRNLKDDGGMIKHPDYDPIPFDQKIKSEIELDGNSTAVQMKDDNPPDPPDIGVRIRK